MASIRPLVTITILAVVGAYLYVKINEGPAPSRAAANAIQAPEGIPPLTGTKGSSLAADSAPPAWPSPAASTAPPSSAPLAAATASQSSSATATNSKEKSLSVPAIPELPPLPAMTESAPSSAPQKDLSATAAPARYPDQPAPSANAGASKDTPGQPAPLNLGAVNPSSPSPPTVAPQASAAAPPTTPSTTPILNPAPSAVSPAPAVGAAMSTTPPSQLGAQNPLRTVSPAPTPGGDPSDRYATASAATPLATSPSPLSTPTTPIDAPTATSFAASWPAIQAALDRRDLKQAHQLLSKWHGNETLSPTDTQKVETLLSQLAGTVIYSTEHQLEPARVVKPGETLEAISKEYNVPPQLLAKINGIQPTGQLQPGQQLKVVRGPFAAVIDVRRSELTLTVDDRYAGKFHVIVPPGMALPDGQWLVDQKVAGATAAVSPTAYITTPAPADRSIVLRNAAATAAGSPTLVIASGSGIGLASNPPALRVSPQDAEEISDILSIGSRVVVRK